MISSKIAMSTSCAHPSPQAATALEEYFGWSKGNWGIADFLSQCAENEIPVWVREACIALKGLCDPPPLPAPPPAPPEENEAELLADLLS